MHGPASLELGARHAGIREKLQPKIHLVTLRYRVARLRAPNYANTNFTLSARYRQLSFSNLFLSTCTYGPLHGRVFSGVYTPVIPCFVVHWRSRIPFSFYLWLHTGFGPSFPFGGGLYSQRSDLVWLAGPLVSSSKATLGRLHDRRRQGMDMDTKFMPGLDCGDVSECE